MVTVEIQSKGRVAVYDKETIGVTGSIKVSIEKAMEIIERQHNKGHNCKIICCSRDTEIQQDQAMEIAMNDTVILGEKSSFNIRCKNGGIIQIENHGNEKDTELLRIELIRRLNNDINARGLAISRYEVDCIIDGGQVWQRKDYRFKGMFESPK